MKKLLLIIVLFSIFILTTCEWHNSYWIKIEQDVDLGSAIHNTCHVSTYVWFGKWYDVGDIEKGFYKYDVPVSFVPSIKAQQLIKAQKVVKELKIALETFEDKCK